MLIRTQNKKQIILLENFVLSITEDNHITATRNISETPILIANSSIAKYSTEEKAIKVLDMIQSTYYDFEYSKFYGRDRTEFDSPIFEMPQDEEVKV